MRAESDFDVVAAVLFSIAVVKAWADQDGGAFCHA